MPQGQLYIKYNSAMTGITNANRYNLSNGVFTQSNSGSYIDAYAQWGVSLDKEGLSQLMAPPPLKEYITNQSALENGVRVVGIPKVGSRELTLGMNISANTESIFLSRYTSFCSTLRLGTVSIITSFQPTVLYRFHFISCTQFAEYRLGVGKFMLRLSEFDPTSRSVS